MSESIDWSNNAVIVLVKEYEKREELWDKDHNMYRVQTAKNMAWRSLAAMFSCDVTDLRKKFNSLLASYRRERTKVKEGGKSTWFLYSHMKFLHGYVRSPDDVLDETASDHFDKLDTLERSNDMESDEPQLSDADEQEMVIIKHEPPVQAFTHSRQNTVNHSKHRLTRTLKRKHKWQNMQNVQDMYSKVYVDSRIIEIKRMIKNEYLKKKDDCDTYGEYIASTLRKHDNKTQCMIKQAINNILFEQEMNKYDNPLENELVEMLDPSDD